MARKKRYAIQGRGWPRRELTWRLSLPTNQLNRNQIEREMREAFQVSSTLKIIASTMISRFFVKSYTILFILKQEKNLF